MMMAAATLSIMMMLVLIMIVVMTTAASAIMMMVLMLFHKLFFQRIYLFHCLKNVLSIDIIPRCCNDGSLIILFTDHLYTGVQLIIRHLLGTAENYCSCIFDLVIVELSVVLHIHFAFLGIYNNSGTVDLNALSDILYCFDNVRQLAYTGRLNDHTVRRILLQHFL